MIISITGPPAAVPVKDDFRVADADVVLPTDFGYLALIGIQSINQSIHTYIAPCVASESEARSG